MHSVGAGVRKAAHAVGTLLEDPAQGLDWFRNGLEIVRGLPGGRGENLYRPSEAPQGRLHELVGASWPCEYKDEFDALWPPVVTSLEAQGSGFGERYDSDEALARATWCCVRHLCPERVVETGVARGVNSRIILEGLERNGTGHLWSIDLPPVLEGWRTQSGAAVTQGLRGRWTFLEGSSRRHLRPLLADLGSVDIFIHDSLHSAANMRFEMSTAWPHVRRGGVMFADDIESNPAFAMFTSALPSTSVLVARQDAMKKGFFGAAVKA
ncbi:MAG: class I SAM-dependent methyltransferase [Actinobacteria bacterium]|nr:class I SAM-dependent methyltransferase [Actinomycetota bacterium]